MYYLGYIDVQQRPLLREVGQGIPLISKEAFIVRQKLTGGTDNQI